MQKKLLFILSLLTIFPQVVLAQGITIAGFEIPFSILVVLVFSLIIIFLFLGTKFPGKFPFGMVVFALFVIVFFLLPFFVSFEFVVPSSWQSFPLPEIFVTIFSILGVPRDWIVMPAFLYLFLIPFAVIFLIVYAFLKELNLFPTSKNISRTLAFLVTFLTIPLGLFAKFIGFVFAVFVGLYAIVLFIVMFIASAFFLSYGGALRAFGKTEIVRTITSELSDINREIAQLAQQLSRETDPNRQAQIKEALAGLRDRRDALRRELREELS